MKVLISTAKDLFVGFCIGVANIIPGVSGGTFLLVFGIYERVIGAINKLSIHSARMAMRHLWLLVAARRKQEARTASRAFVEHMDFAFMARILIGAGIAIVALSSLMKYLLKNHFPYTYAFFFGLILVSAAIPYRLLSRKHWSLPAFGIAGAALTILVTATVNPYDKVRIKSEQYRVQYEQEIANQSNAGQTSGIAFSGKYQIREYVMIFIAGAAAVSAMVLPGISGSLVLILLGQYYEVIAAIAGLRTLAFDNLLFLAIFALGMVLGLIAFARLVGYVFKRWYNPTMAFLLGLMIGSLYALWPFKETVVIDQYVKEDGVIRLVQDVVVYTNTNTLPPSASQFGLALFSCAVGALIMAFFVRRETESAAVDQPAL